MTRTIAVCTVMLWAASAAAGPEAKKPVAPVEGVPITTTSDEARQLYTQARDLQERLRATDAFAIYQKAIAKDPEFALAYFGAANTSGSAKEFRALLERAVALAPKTSPSEQLLIKSAEAGANGDPAAQKKLLEKLAKLHPTDKRVLTQLGTYYMGRQDYAVAAKTFERAVKADPSYNPPYNQLGYAYRFIGKPADAERAFKKYVELLPTDPNPHDSYAELLMEQGRFEESIKSYERALTVDPNFIASYVGIGNNQIFLGRGEAARATFGKLFKVGRNDGERRQAIFWTSVSYLHESAWDKALAEAEKLVAISTKSGDLLTVSQDYNYMGNILLEAGRADEAATKFKVQLETNAKASVPEEVKQAAVRNNLYDVARVALAKNDLPTAKAKAAEYGKQVGVKKVPFEVRQHQSLLGMIAIAEKKWSTAIAHLGKGNPRDPRMPYLIAVAYAGKGDAKRAKANAAKAADFNGLAVNFAYVRAKAKAMVAGATR